MKKILILVAIFSIAFTVNAQFFIGGQFGMGVQNMTTKSDKSLPVVTVNSNTQSFSFGFGPRLGYCIKNKKWAVGTDIIFNIGGNSSTSYNTNNKKDTKQVNTTTNFAWGIYPFARYTFFTYQRFSLGIEGNFGIGSRHSSTINKTSTNTNKTNAANQVDIQIFNIKPWMALKLKEHLYIESTLGVLGFHYNIRVEPPQGNKNAKSTTTNHDFGLNFRDLNMATLGLVYRF